MMSGGNDYDVSHLAAASKWHYNWIPDEAVVLMQPEGPTTACPSCQSSVTGLELVTFDNASVEPSSTNKMAVHIPVLAEDNTAYSYWLSYCGFGNDGLAAGGLSIHVTEFELTPETNFAAYYDSLNYDAFGDTASTDDSFVLPETCYLVTPPLILMDIDPSAVEQVQPIVCVDSVDTGSNSITISVSFLDNTDTGTEEITPAIELASKTEVGCSSGSGISSGPLSFDMSGGKVHLIHQTGTGSDGLITLSLCVESGSASTVQAFLYDT